MCAVSITRVVATYAVAGQYLQHPDDVIYYTAPIFFWTNIELSLGVVCACLPTLRPIWFFFYPRQSTQTGSGYGYESSGKDFGSSGTNGMMNTSFGGKLARKPYQEIDEIELTRRGQSPPATPPEDEPTASERHIIVATTIHQTLE